MKPIDQGTITWAELQIHVSGWRRRTLLALQKQGPCTTRALAAACGADVLSIRPRVTELIHLGFVQIVPGETHRHEGVYRALTVAEAQELFATRRAAARSRPGHRELPCNNRTASAPG